MYPGPRYPLVPHVVVGSDKPFHETVCDFATISTLFFHHNQCCIVQTRIPNRLYMTVDRLVLLGPDSNLGLGFRGSRYKLAGTRGLVASRAVSTLVVNIFVGVVFFRLFCKYFACVGLRTVEVVTVTYWEPKWRQLGTSFLIDNTYKCVAGPATLTTLK
jgi:hypothetical protein